MWIRYVRYDGNTGAVNTDNVSAITTVSYSSVAEDRYSVEASLPDGTQLQLVSPTVTQREADDIVLKLLAALRKGFFIYDMELEQGRKCGVIHNVREM